MCQFSSHDAGSGGHGGQVGLCYVILMSGSLFRNEFASNFLDPPVGLRNNGAGGEDRTRNLSLTKRLHYRCATPACGLGQQGVTLNPNPPMDGARIAEGGEEVTDATVRARIRVDWRLAGGLSALLGVLIAACDGCGERDGGIGHGKKHSRTGPGASWRGS